MDRQELQDRTKMFARRIIRLVKELSRSEIGRITGRQVLRCGTSVGANYRAAGRGRSKAEFVARRGIVEEEADESVFWLERICDEQLLAPSRVQPLLDEARQLVAIISASRKTARNRK
jgi:four helix bundle protein